MRLAALLVGMVGSLLGLISTWGLAQAYSNLTALGTVAVEQVEGLEMSPQTVVALLWLGVLCFSVGTVGAALSLVRPRTAGYMLILAGVTGAFTGGSTPFILMMCVLMVVGGVFALRGAKEGERRG